MQGRTAFVESLAETMLLVINNIEEREPVEPDLAIVRELAEQLLEEVESLDEEV